MKGIELTQQVVDALGFEKQADNSYILVSRNIIIKLRKDNRATHSWTLGDPPTQHSVTHVDEIFGCLYLDGEYNGKRAKAAEIQRVLSCESD